MSAVVISTVVSTVFPSQVSVGLKWGVLAAFFGLSVIALFSYLRNARTIETGHFQVVPKRHKRSFALTFFR